MGLAANTFNAYLRTIFVARCRTRLLLKLCFHPSRFSSYSIETLSRRKHHLQLSKCHPEQLVDGPNAVGAAVMLKQIPRLADLIPSKRREKVIMVGAGRHPPCDLNEIARATQAERLTVMISLGCFLIKKSSTCWIRNSTCIPSVGLGFWRFAGAC